MKSGKSLTVSFLLLGIMSAFAGARGVVNNVPFGNMAFMVAGACLILLGLYATFLIQNKRKRNDIKCTMVTQLRDERSIIKLQCVLDRGHTGQHLTYLSGNTPYVWTEPIGTK